MTPELELLTAELMLVSIIFLTPFLQHHPSEIIFLAFFSDISFCHHF
jgi:hypothetical protein